MSNIPNFNRDLSNPSSTYNRGADTQQQDKIVEPVEVNLLTIDTAILKFLQEKIAPTVMQGDKMIKVPIIYGNPERWKAIQKDGVFRDQNGKIHLPIMMIRRMSMKKNSLNSPVNKYQQYLFKIGWNSRNVYDRFAVLNKMIPSDVYHSSVVPDYYDISYEVMVWTEYMEQMNKIIESISFEEGEYWGEETGYRFITKISQYDQTTDMPMDDDRIIRNKFNIDIKAYILPKASLNREGKKQVTTRTVYGPKRVVFDAEVVTDLRMKK
jgi:hypothetical protein